MLRRLYPSSKIRLSATRIFSSYFLRAVQQIVRNYEEGIGIAFIARNVENIFLSRSRFELFVGKNKEKQILIYNSTGLLERYHIAKQALRLDSCVVVAARFTNSSGVHLTPSIFYPAVAHAVKIHANLSARVCNEKGTGSQSPYFSQLQSVSLEDAVQFVDDDSSSLAVLLEKELATSFDSSSDKPLWRIKVTNDDLVIFAWQHAIGDGLSGLAVLRTLKLALNGDCAISTDGAFREVEPPSHLVLEKPIEEITDCSVSWATLLREVGGIVIPRAWALKGVWTGNPVAVSATDNLKKRVRIISLPAFEASTWLSLCRKHNSTLTGLLYALSISLISKAVGSGDDAQQFNLLSAYVPVSFRPFAKIPHTVMCEAISSYHVLEPFILRDGIPWSRASSFSKDIQIAIPRTRETIGALRFLFGNFEGYIRGKLGKKRDGSFALSNLGVFIGEDGSDKETQEWSIGDTYFAQDDAVVGSALRLNAVGSPSGSINITVTWSEACVEERIAEQYAEGLRQTLKEVTE